MLLTAGLTLLCLLFSAGLALGGAGAPAAVAHLAFAAGIVPLIFAAISHFVPVLTRTGDPERSICRLPLVAQLAGVLAVAAMQGVLPRPLLHLIAAVDFILAAILLRWIFVRAGRCLGSPHPGWRWYAAALSCLLLALLAVPVLLAFPALYGVLRLAHIHLNTLGLVGLAALGTLPVLLPTALGKGDPGAASWLKRRLWPALLGVLLLALGVATGWPLAEPGAAILFVVVFGLLGQWIRHYGVQALVADGVAASLLAAVVGLLIMLAAGVAHSAGLLPARPAIAAWAVSFLLPLVTGALSQLLPVWRWPGPARPERLAMRQQLAASGAWRGGLLVAGGGFLLAGFLPAAALLLVAGLGLFVFALIQAVRGGASTR